MAVKHPLRRYLGGHARPTSMGLSLLLSLLCLPLGERPGLVNDAIAATGPVLQITGYALISKAKASNTEFDYTFSATVKNSGPADALDVKAKADSLKPAIKLKSPNLKFGDVPAGATVASRGTFTLRKTEATAFNPADLAWQFDAKFAPYANAGPDQSVKVGSKVFLDGSVSGNEDEDEDEPLRYQWGFVSKPLGSTAALSNATIVNPTFIADKSGAYTLQLVVLQEDRTSLSDTVVINTVNSAPVANPGPGQSAKLGGTVILDGSGSSDADKDPLTYKWAITNKPANSTASLANATAVNPSLVVDKAGIYAIQLIVNDGKVDSEAKIVLVSTLNTRPVANAGPDRSAKVNDLVTLDGAGSSDDDGNALTYTWSLLTKPAGSIAALNDITAVKPNFAIDKPGVYVAQLIVHDALADSVPDTVIITTENSKPVANPGPDQTVALNALVQLDGILSSDPDKDPLAYQWSLLSKPAGSTATLANPNSARPSFIATKPGNYVLELVVSDGKLNSIPATVTVSTLNSRPVANAGQDQTASQKQVLLDGSGSFDADSDPLGYQWALLSKPANSQAILDSLISKQPGFTADLPGFYVSQLIVNDGKLDSDPDTVTVEVPSALFNRPPAITSAAPLLAQAGQAYRYDVDAIDSDLGDLLVFSLLSGPDGMTIDPNSGVIQWTPALAQAGQQAISIEVSDSFGAKATQSFTVSVSSPITTFTVPKLAGLGRADAVSALLDALLTVGNLTFQHSNTVASGKVIQAAPSAGTDVDKATPVDLVVSLGEDNGLPPDPAVIAPAPAPTASFTPLKQSTEFLYSGKNPIQTGVAAGAIDPKRVAVLRGKVLTRDNKALPGVTITIKDHPELGQTLSRADGQFDLAANGGGILTLNYEKAGFLPVQRKFDTPWQDYVAAEDVVMIPVDSKVTGVDLNAAAPQAAQGSVSTDADGPRQATVLFPAGTQATMTLPDGSTQPLTNLHVRATEYTVGENGPEAMPGPLPPTSGYTYAVELSVDEAQAAGATQVKFNQAVPLYVDNFLGFPVGEVVPVGWYDRDKGAWVASDNGRVIKVLSVSGGIAALDTNGDGQADSDTELSTLGITRQEQAQLAILYAPGKTLWRSPVTHFTPWDCNWPYGPPPDSEPPPNDEPEPEDQDNPDDNQSDCQQGCVINAQNQVLGEDLDITGTPYSLHYRSDRMAGNISDNTVTVPLSSASVPDTLKRIELVITVAGREFKKSFIPAPNLNYTFNWDGKNAYGQLVNASQTARIRVGYVYGAVYYRSRADFESSFGMASNTSGGSGSGGLAIVASRPNLEITQRKDWYIELGIGNPIQVFGGWGLNVLHSYDPNSKRQFRGNGSKVSAETLGSVITTFAGNSSGNKLIDNILAKDASIFPADLASGPDGSIYLVDLNRFVIRRILPNGIITTVAGNGANGSFFEDFSNMEGPATQLPLGNQLTETIEIAVGKNGEIYIADRENNIIRRVGTDGIIRNFAGSDTGLSGYNGDGIQASEALLTHPADMVVSGDGSLYFSDNNRIRKIGTDGIIRTVAGNGSFGFSGDGGTALNASFRNIRGLAVGQDGTLYISDANNFRVRRVGTDGIITTMAGNGFTSGFSGDGGPASKAFFGSVHKIYLAQDNSLYVVDGENARIRKIGPDGIINTIAGTDFFPGVSRNDGALATETYISSPCALPMPDGSIYICEVNKIRRISSRLPGFGIDDFSIPSQDGSEVYRFDAQGRHVETRSTLTNAVLYRFAYDSRGNLINVTDVNGDVTRIDRDALGNPVAIVSQDGQRTSLELDANGFLAKVTNPANESHAMAYTADGLLTQFSTPKNLSNTYEYDALGRLIKDTDPVLGGWILDRAKLSQGFVTTMTSGEGRTSQFKVEPITTGDRRHTNTNPDSTTQTTLYKTNGEQIVTSADGVVTSLLQTPDPRFGMQAPLTGTLSVKLPSGLISTATTTRTTPLSNPSDLQSLISQTETTSVNGKNYVSVFNKAALTITQTSPQDRKVTRQLDVKGKPVQTTIANLEPVNYSYDTRGRLAQIDQGQAPDTRSTQITYNAQGYVGTITNALNQVTSLQYDLAGRVTRRVLPDNREVNYTYDANGNLTSITPPGRPPHIFSHTPVDLTQDYTPPVAGLGNPQTLYRYNKDKQLTQITRPDLQELNYTYSPTSGKLSELSLPTGAYTYQYAPITGQLSSVTAPGGGRLNFTYDGFLLKDSTWSGQITGSVGRTYNSDFNVTELTVNGADPVAFEYDNDQLLVKAGDLNLGRHPQNGFIVSSSLGVVSDSYTYNSFGEVSGYTAKGNGDDVFATAYTRDLLGRISQKTETADNTSHTEAYAYDAAGRLTEVKRDGTVQATYGYDANGNRTAINGNTVAQYDSQDRLTHYAGISYAYTPNGELRTRTVGGNTVTYDYDVLGNLKKVTFGNGPSTGSGQATIEYLIDGQNRRVGKKANGTLAKGWLYQDGLRPIVELDGNNQVVARFVYGSKGNVPDYMVKEGNTYRIISDHLGSPRLVIDTSNNVVAQEISYDVWGNITQDTNPGFQPFGFAGGLYDNDTKLVRFGARDYDAQTGRWTAKDPIQFSGGDTNLYGYVLSDPVNRIDPIGLTWADVEHAQNILHKLYPDYYNKNIPVKFGTPESGTTADYDPFGKTITLPKEYECELTYDQKTKLLQALAHEYQHANDDYITQAITMFEDSLDAYGIETQGRHWQIEENSNNLSKEAYDQMTR